MKDEYDSGAALERFFEAAGTHVIRRIAMKLDYPPQPLRAMINSGRLSSTILLRMMRAYGVSPDWILFGGSGRYVRFTDSQETLV